MNTDKLNKICIAMAMEQEAQPFIEYFNLVKAPDVFSKHLPFVCYQAPNDNSLSVVVSGRDPRYDVDNIGTQAATLQAYASIQALAPDLMISAGTAGGFASRGAQIGTVYLSDDKCVFHDRRVPIEGFNESAIGHLPVLKVNKMALDLDMPLGVISSGSSLEKSDKDIEVIERFNAVAKEMEAAAVAWVCWLHCLPFFAVKSITNLLDEPESSEEQFLENLQFSSDKLTEKLVQVVQYLKDKSLSDLSV